MTASQQESSALKVLVVVKRRCLYDTITQILIHYPTPVECALITSSSELAAESSFQPDIILADPFTSFEASQPDFYKALCWGGSIPLIALLTIDSRDYRDAAVLMGVNGVVIWEEIADKLIPTITKVLASTRLVNGVADQITSTAKISAPAGESAYPKDPGSHNLAELSGRAVEKLAAKLSPTPSMLNTPPTQEPQNRQFYLRGLAFSAVSRIAAEPVRIARTACSLNCGSHFCGLKMTVSGDHIRKIEPADFPDRRYRRICLKGISFTQMASHPERLLYPLKRLGERGADCWQRISWDQALSEITRRMADIMQATGPESLMFFSYSGQSSALNGVGGAYLRLASLLGASGTSLREFGIDSAVPSGVVDTLGEGAGYLANDYADLHHSRLILIWGGNPVQSRANWWPFFLEARQAGARLVAIDPKFTPTAAKCDQWLPIRPGTDLYLALGMIRELIENGWIDRDFVLRYSVAPFLVRQDNGRFLRSMDLGGVPSQEDYLVWDETSGRAISSRNPSKPALSAHVKIAGIPCRTAFDLLREMVASYTPEFVSQKTGLPIDQVRGLAKEYALSKPARIYTLYGIDRWHHGATFGRLITTLAALTGNIGIPGGGAGVDALSEPFMLPSQFAYPDGKEYHPVNPARLPEQIATGQPYPIKGMLAALGNWLNQWPDRNRLIREVLPRLDLFVVVDHFMTGTARWADYVLPAAMFFEREDLVKGPGPYVQYQPAILPPPGECTPDLEIAARLAERLGLGEYFSKKPEEYLTEILARGDESYRELSLDELREHGVATRKLSPDSLVPFHDHHFATPTGRVELYVERLLPYHQALPVYQPPIEADLEGELAKRFPLICISEHNRYNVHSTLTKSPWLRELDPEPIAVLHPETALQRQIEDGDLVKVFNERGFLVLRAHLSQSVPVRTVYLTPGWGPQDYYAGHIEDVMHAQGNPSNALGPNMSFSDVLVEVQKFPVEAKARPDG